MHMVRHYFHQGESGRPPVRALLLTEVRRMRRGHLQMASGTDYSAVADGLLTEF